jgi:hypothetical protein
MLKVCGSYHDSVEIVTSKKLLRVLVLLRLYIEQILHLCRAVFSGNAP